MTLLRKKGSNILINHMLYYNLENHKDILIKVPDHAVSENLKGQINILKENKNITACDFYNKNGYTVIATENKQLIVYDKNFNVLKNFTTSRTASKVCFSPTDGILVADKTGDVYLYTLDDDKEQLLLGHLSVILDMTLSECGKYIITCDRDEKIRVSCFPNAYNIVSFCLGHTEFVTNIKLVKSILVSASGDGTVRFWNYLEGKQFAVINTNEYITDCNLLDSFVKLMDNEKVDVSALPITDMQVFCDGRQLYIGVQIYKYTSLQVHMLDLSTFNCNYVMKIDTASSFSFYFSNEMYIFNNKFYVYKLVNGKFVEISVPSLGNLFDKYRDILKHTEDDSVTILYKRKFDNVQEYLERKRQRLEGK